jgi:spore germination protein YaaH
MSMQRICNLIVAFLLAAAALAPPASPARAAALPAAAAVAASPIEHSPRIMQAAAEMAAKPATASSQLSGATTRIINHPLALAATAGLRREVFGFVNAGNLGSPTVGYASWNFNLLTTVAYFGLQVNSGDGSLVQGDTGWNVEHSATMGGLVSSAHAVGARVIISLNLHDFSTSPTNQVCQGLIAANAQTTISQAVAQEAASGVDGLNVDYEGTNTTCANGGTSRAELVSFVQGLRAAMPPGSYLAVDTYSGSAEDNLEFFNVPALAAAADSLFVMAYDMDYSNYHYPPNNCASFCFNPVSPLVGYRFNDTLAMAQYTALVPASKVILGLPYYGRKGCVQSLNFAHQLPTRFDAPYFVAPTYLYSVATPTDTGVASFSAHRDPSDGQSEWDTWYSSDFTCNREQYWDDVQSLGAKYDLVNRDNLRGVGLFTLDYGGSAPELWNSLSAHFACPGTVFAAGNFTGTGGSLAVRTGGTCVMQATATGFSTPTPWATYPFYGSVATLVGDVTGDGKTDVVAVNGAQTFVMASSGTAFAAPALWSNTPFYGTRGTFLADVNGDGKADLVAVNYSSVFVMLSTGTSFGPPSLWSGIPFSGDVTMLVGDVTGDHKADVVAVNHNNTWVMTSTGSRFGSPYLWSNAPFYGSVATMIGDVNGDGRSDLVAVNGTNSWVMTSTGGSFGPSTMWLNAPFYGSVATMLADVAGSGKASLVAVNGTTIFVAPSTGSGFSAPALWYYGPT